MSFLISEKQSKISDPGRPGAYDNRLGEDALPWGTPVPVQEYGDALKEKGNTTLVNEDGTMWTQYETAALVRVPTFDAAPVSQQEARRLLWKSRAGVLNFTLEPDERHPANAWHYVCRDGAYTLDNLAAEVRRHVRRAQGSLRIEPLEWEVLLKHGFRAYSDTRVRLGLSDGSLAMFRQRFSEFSFYPGHYTVGAWRGDTLAAFVTLIVVDDWVVMEGSFSATAELAQRPNNGLAHYVLEHFLVKRNFRTVSFGTSSIQESSRESGLHDYKVRIGFEAKPIHRAFVLHPLLRPLANPVTLWTMKAALRLNPGNRRLLKAIGAVNCLLAARATNDVPVNTVA